MYLKKILSKEIILRIVGAVLLIAFAVSSATFIAKKATSPESYKTTIQSIDEKKLAVMGVSASTAVAATALAAVPGDVTTPIAEQIMDLSTYLFIVVCILVLEKSLLTVLGLLSFQIMIPISCALLTISMFVRKRTLGIIGFKILILALAIVMIIPLSIKIGDMIYEANKTTVEQVTTTVDENNIEQVEEEAPSWLDRLIAKAKQTTVDIGIKAKQMLNALIDAIAIFVIAYCVLPILIVVFTIWLINYLFGMSIPIPKILLRKEKEKVTTKENLIEYE